MTASIEKLAAEALADDTKATRGPWTAVKCSQGWNVDSSPGEFGVCSLWVDGGDDDGVEEDASFIASARTREPQLAAWVQKVAPLIEQLRGSLLNGADIGPYSAVFAILEATKEQP